MQGGKPRSGSFSNQKTLTADLRRHFVILLLENIILMDQGYVSGLVFHHMDARGVFFRKQEAREEELADYDKLGVLEFTCRTLRF
jgi:hypothetical protein